MWCKCYGNWLHRGNKEELDFEEKQYIYDHLGFRVIITFLAVIIRRSECVMEGEMFYESSFIFVEKSQVR